MLTKIKMALAAGGVILAVVGVTRDSKVVAWIAIGLLTMAVILSLVLGGQKPPPQ